MSCEKFEKKGGITIPCSGEVFPDEHGLRACEHHDPVRFRARHEERFQPADGPRCYSKDGENDRYCHRPEEHEGWHGCRYVVAATGEFATARLIETWWP